ncbi:hypothetical protein [Candidatus Methylomirabilis sp.]|uniref:hypothetical protein n=1 Tax=Candidatus Methylomirabilis sp. TaxID=2032687 RepID=UPI003076214E
MEQVDIWVSHLDKYFEHHGGSTLLNHSCLISSLLFPLIHAHGFVFHEATFNELYDGMLAFMRSDQLRYIAEGFLTNVESEVDTHALLGSFALVRLTPEERTNLRSDLGITVPVDWRFDHAQPAYAIKVSFLRDKRLSPQRGNEQQGIHWSEEVANSMYQVITALRLIKPGRIGLPVIVFRNLDWIPEGGPVWLSAASIPADDHFNIEATDRDVVTKVFESLHELPRYLELAVHRFNLPYERSRLDDRLIDQMISLEALYAKDSRAELGYRISIRGALATGVDHADRRNRFDWLRKAYDARSDIVHGQELRNTKIGGKKVAPHDLVTFTEQNVRESIRFFLSHLARSNQMEVLNDIDDKALT